MKKQINLTKEELDELILKLIVGISELGDETLDSLLVFDLGFDSLDAVELIMYIETELSISIDDSDSGVIMKMETGNIIINALLEEYVTCKE